MFGYIFAISRFGIRAVLGRMKSPRQHVETIETSNTTAFFTLLWLLRIVLLRYWDYLWARQKATPSPCASRGLIELLSFIRKVMLRNHPSSWKPPRPYLSEIPTELFLSIVDFLPPESAVCVSLLSRYHHEVLRTRIDMKFQRQATSTSDKMRFVRLLERDIPKLIACNNCNKLYPWRRNRANRLSACPRHHCRTPEYFGDQPTFRIPEIVRNSRDVVDFFVRGLEIGTLNGPRLERLEHKERLPVWSAGNGIVTNTQARVAEGRLLLRKTHELSVPMLDELAPNLLKFRELVCHQSSQLPAVIMDAIDELRYGTSSGRSGYYISCNHCALDLRVAVRLLDPKHLNIQVDTWKCFGNRTFEMEHPSIQTVVGEGPGPRDDSVGTPTRNLEKLFNTGEGPQLHLPVGGPPSRPDQPHIWLNAWWWRWSWYLPHPANEANYHVPSVGGGPRDRKRLLAAATVRDVLSLGGAPS